MLVVISEYSHDCDFHKQSCYDHNYSCDSDKLARTVFSTSLLVENGSQLHACENHKEIFLTVQLLVLSDFPPF